MKTRLGRTKIKFFIGERNKPARDQLHGWQAHNSNIEIVSLDYFPVTDTYTLTYREEITEYNYAPLPFLPNP